MSLILFQNEDPVSMILSHLPDEIIRSIKRFVFVRKDRHIMFSCTICKIAEFFIDYNLSLSYTWGTCCSDRCAVIAIKQNARFDRLVRYPHTRKLIKKYPYFHLRYPNGRYSFDSRFDDEDVDRYDKFIRGNDLLECASKLFE